MRRGTRGMVLSGDCRFNPAFAKNLIENANFRMHTHRRRRRTLVVFALRRAATAPFSALGGRREGNRRIGPEDDCDWTFTRSQFMEADSRSRSFTVRI